MTTPPQAPPAVIPDPDPYVPAGPLDYAPGGFRRAERAGALVHVLRDVEMGAYDLRIMTWLLGLDDSTIRTILSVMERVREAGRAEGLSGEQVAR